MGKTTRPMWSLFQECPLQGHDGYCKRALHHDQFDFIFRCLTDAKESIRILGVSCGYGRLSVPLIKAFPEAYILVMDVIHRDVKLYDEDTGKKAFVGTLAAIPPEIVTFGRIVAVTFFMYMESGRCPALDIGHR